MDFDPSNPSDPNSEQQYPMCFGCGRRNPCGLHLVFRWDDGRALAEFIPGEVHQGWPGIMHGGVMNALLDEAMGYATYLSGLRTVTARMTIRFRHTARIGEKLLLTGELVQVRRRLAEVKATASLTDGSVLAESTATMFVLKEDEMPSYGIA